MLLISLPWSSVRIIGILLVAREVKHNFLNGSPCELRFPMLMRAFRTLINAMRRLH